MPWSRMANLLVATGVGALFLAGLFTHGVVAAVLLLVVAALLGYLSRQAWPTIPGRGRLVRVLVVIAILAVAVAKIANR